RPLPRRGAHDGTLPRLLPAPVALLHLELRALAQAGRQGHRRPGRRDLAQEAGIVRGAAAGRRHPGRAGRLRDPPPPRTRRLAPRPPAARERTMGATRGSAGMQEACDGPATASADRGVEFVTRAPRSAGIYPGTPRRANPPVLPQRWPARGYRPAPGGRRRAAALAAT